MRTPCLALPLVILSLLTLSFTAATPALAAFTLPSWLVPPPPRQPNPPPVPVPDCVTPPSGLVSWWKGDGNALDSVGDNNGTIPNGTSNGVSYVAGIVGQAFSFNGSNSYVEVPDSPALRLTNDLTIELWAKRKQITGRPYGDVFVEKGGDWTGGVENYGVAVSSAEYGNLFTLYFAGGDRGCGDINDLNWHHFAVVVHNGDVDPIFYIDGVQQPVTWREGASTINLYPSTAPLHIGAQIDPNFVYYSDTLIDELSIYDRGLSSNEIAAIYHAGSAGKCTSGLPVHYPVPQIFGITPAVATNGAVITITGTNFNSNVASNIVRFGAVQANVISASPTSLTLKVPVGATYAPVTVTVNGLTASSSRFFEPIFIGDGSSLSAASFGSRLDLPASSNPYKVVIADVDGDGKPDMIVANVFNNTISLYRNISTNGVLTENSFAPRVDLPTSTGQYSPYGLAVADVDGDGKPDLIDIDYNNSIVSVYRNISTPNTIDSNSFAPRVDFACGLQPEGVEVKDIDGDGRPDLITANRGDGTISILRNISQRGSITSDSFAGHVDIVTGTSCDSVVAGDLDGDGKPDIAVANTDDGTISVLRNLASPGSITADSFAPKVDFAVASSLIQLTIGDVDGDGKLDLAVAAYGPQAVLVLHNTSTVGNLSFDSPVSFSLGGNGHVPAFADLNGDGKIDLAAVTEQGSALSFFQNVGTSGTFDADSLGARVDLATGWNAWGLAVADLDGDGRPDFIFCNQYDNTISIYQNQVPRLHGQLPVITSPPVNQTALEGSSATFSVTATGGGTLYYQWKFGNTNILQATNTTLTLTNLQPAQTGSYTITVSNSYGSVSSSALLTVTTQNVLLYNYSGSEKVTTANQEFTYNYSGEMFFLPGTTNGVFVGWATINGKKQYWVSPFSDYLLATIPGAANRTYTILGKAGNEFDPNGRPHIWSNLHKGQNTMLSVGVNKTLSFPNTFSCNDSQVYPDPQTGVMVLREATSTYTYSSLATLSANMSCQTLTEQVNALTQSLIRQGYQLQ